MLTFEPNVLPVYAITDFGAVGDGSTDDTAAWAKAVTAAASKPAAIYLPRGFDSYVANGINANNSAGLQIIGGAGPYSPNSNTPLPRIWTNRSDGGALLSVQSSRNVCLRGVNLYHGGPYGISASCIDASGSVGTPTQMLEISYCVVQAITNAGSNVLLVRGKDNVNPLLEHSQFIGGNYGILGLESAADFCNAVNVRACAFQLQGLAAVANMGQGINIAGNAFEPLAGGTLRGIWLQFPAQGVNIAGNVFEDATASSGYCLIQGNGINIAGNIFYGPNNGTGVQLVGSTDGAHIAGNLFRGLTLGIDKNSQTATNIGIGPNSYVSTTTHHNFTAAGTLYIEA